VGKTIREKTSVLPRSYASSRHLALVQVSSPGCQPPATGKGSVTPVSIRPDRSRRSSIAVRPLLVDRDVVADAGVDAQPDVLPVGGQRDRAEPLPLNPFGEVRRDAADRRTVKLCTRPSASPAERGHSLLETTFEACAESASTPGPSAPSPPPSSSPSPQRPNHVITDSADPLLGMAHRGRTACRWPSPAQVGVADGGLTSCQQDAAQKGFGRRPGGISTPQSRNSQRAATMRDHHGSRSLTT